MSNFKAKIHKIRFPHAPLHGELICVSQDSLAVFNRPTSKEGKGNEKEKGERGKEGQGINHAL